MVTCYLEARTIILSVLVVIGIKFIDNNTVVRWIVLPKGNNIVTLYCRTKITRNNITFSSNMVFLRSYSSDDFFSNRTNYS